MKILVLGANAAIAGVWLGDGDCLLLAQVKRYDRWVGKRRDRVGFFHSPNLFVRLLGNSEYVVIQESGFYGHSTVHVLQNSAVPYFQVQIVLRNHLSLAFEFSEQH